MCVQKRCARENCYFHRRFHAGNRASREKQNHNCLFMRRLRPDGETTSAGWDYRCRPGRGQRMCSQLEGGKLTDLLKPPPAETGFATRETPELIKFDTPGKRIAGKLLSCTRIQIEGKTVLEYLLTADGKKNFKFLGVYDLVQKIGPRDAGSLVAITYLGEDEKVGRGNNKMKVFDVQVKPAPQDPHGPITDEDIPF
jgi:hypothetical protein